MRQPAFVDTPMQQQDLGAEHKQLTPYVSLRESAKSPHSSLNGLRKSIVGGNLTARNSSSSGGVLQHHHQQQKALPLKQEVLVKYKWKDRKKWPLYEKPLLRALIEPELYIRPHHDTPRNPFHLHSPHRAKDHLKRLVPARKPFK
jgi:hypothetical protein